MFPTNSNVGSADISLLAHTLVAVATALGAFGGFPDPPHIFKDVIQYEFVKWVLLAILIWQGGGGASNNEVRDIILTAVITICMYVGKRILNAMYSKDKNRNA